MITGYRPNEIKSLCTPLLADFILWILSLSTFIFGLYRAKLDNVSQNKLF